MSNPYDLRLHALWHFCTHHQMLMEQVARCGCFFCLSLFGPAEIQDWTDDGKTALCPRCGVDSVLPDLPLYTLDRTLLTEMHAQFFS